jgi:hypothetical protein
MQQASKLHRFTGDEPISLISTTTEEAANMSVLAAGPEEPAAAIHESFVKTWGISSGAYAAIEAANVAATD